MKPPVHFKRLKLAMRQDTIGRAIWPIVEEIKLRVALAMLQGK